MKKIDARSLSPEAQEERRHQALRLREELQLTWKEIARVVGVHIGQWQRFEQNPHTPRKPTERSSEAFTKPP